MAVMDDKLPKVSIILTAYNVEKYISGCIDGLLAQTLKEFELIIVDDGSTDQTGDIVRQYASRDKRIIPIFFSENTVGGVGSAANAGIDAARGEYVGFADGDDLYYPEMFLSLYNAALLNDADMSICNYKLLNDLTGEKNEPADTFRWFDIDENSIEATEVNKKKLLRLISVPWRKLYRRSMLEKHQLRFPVGNYYYEDNPFHWFTIIKSQRVALLNKALCEHRVFREGQTMSYSGDNLIAMFEHHTTIFNWLVENEIFSAYREDLVIWLCEQVSWTSDKIDESSRPLFMSEGKKAFEGYTTSQIVRAFRAGNVGHDARLKAYFMSKGDEAGFNGAFEPEANFSLGYQAWLHIKLYGIADLLRIIPQFVKFKYPAWMKWRPKSRYRRLEEKLDQAITGILILEEQIKSLTKK